MIWHIFRKDLKLLWRMVIGVALVNLLDRAIQSSAGIFRNSKALFPTGSGTLRAMWGTISLLATGIILRL